MVNEYSIFDDDVQTRFAFGDELLDDDLIYEMYDVLSCLENDSLNNILNEKDNASQIKNELLKNDFVKNNSTDEVDVKKEVMNISSVNLNKLLKKYNLSTSGKKKKLVKLAIQNIPPHEFEVDSYEITSKGEEFLKNHDWIDYYNYALYSFEISDFSRYIKENDGEVTQLGLDFIDKHLKLACKNENFIYHEACIEAISLTYLFKKDYQNCLNSELKRFIFRLNPQYYTHIDFYSKDYFDLENISNIRDLINELGISDVEELFYQIWDEMDLKKEYISKKLSLNYLDLLINDDADIYELNEKHDYTIFTAKEYYDISLYYYQNNNYLISSDFFNIAIEMEPNCIDGIYYEALSYIHSKNWELVNSDIDEALEINSDDARFLNLKGIVLFETASIEKSKEYFKKALKLNPNDSRILNAIGVCYARLEIPKKQLSILINQFLFQRII